MRTYEEYDESKTRNLITLNVDNLPLEVHNMSTIVYDFRMYLAYAQKSHSIAVSKFKRHKSELGAIIRSDPSEYGLSPPNLKDAIDEAVEIDEKTEKLELDVIEKKFVLDKITAACESLSEKSFNLSRAVKLWLRNLYADEPLTSEELKAVESEEYEETYERLAEIMKKRRNENEVQSR